MDLHDTDASTTPRSARWPSARSLRNGLAMAVVLSLAILIAPLPVIAAPMTDTSIQISDPAPGAQPAITISGVAATTRTSGGSRIDNVRIQFAQGFTTVNDVSAAQIFSAGGGGCAGITAARVCIGGSEVTVSSVQYPSSSQLRINFGNQNTVAGTTVIAFRIDGGTVTNPASPGAYGINWWLVDNNTLVDDAFAAVSIGNLTFTIGSSLPSLVSFSFDPGPVDLAVDPASGPAGTEVVLVQALTVSTNADNGFVVQARMPPPTITGGAETIPAITPDLSVLGNWSLAGSSQFGISRRLNPGSGSVGGLACGSTDCGVWQTDYAGIPVSGTGNTVTLFTSSGPASEAAMDIAWRVAASFAQPAGDYSSTVTYTVIGLP